VPVHSHASNSCDLIQGHLLCIINPLVGMAQATVARSGGVARLSFGDWRELQIQDYAVNERIKAKTVRLIASDGRQIGIMSLKEALERAQQEKLDLVEVGPGADPPVCRLLDFGKFKYRQKKRTHGRHRVQLKEVRIGINTGAHDLDVKAAHVRQFLASGNRVAVSMKLAGRQKAHENLALERMSEFASRFADVAKLVTPPRKENPGRISMTLVPT